jgi:hypothetical protein
VSTLDTWDQSTQIDYHHNVAMPGKRAGWNIPSIAVANEPINTIRSSSNTRFVSPRIAVQAGMVADPTTTSPVYKAIPNMAQSIQVDAPVQVQFSATIRTSNAQSPYFAIFRDGIKISQEYRQAAPGGANEVLVTGSYLDSSPTKGWHSYDLRWHVDPPLFGTITAGSRNRTFQASNLRAQ